MKRLHPKKRAISQLKRPKRNPCINKDAEFELLLSVTCSGKDDFGRFDLRSICWRGSCSEQNAEEIKISLSQIGRTFLFLFFLWIAGIYYRFGAGCSNKTAEEGKTKYEGSFFHRKRMIEGAPK
jgi:hypothetical protein